MSDANEQDVPDLWMRHMRSGAFEAAWRLTDANVKARAGKPCWHLPRHFQYIWDGTPLHGKRVLVRCYHGLGDTIQFIRYAPLLKAIAKKVIVWAQPPLIPLLGAVDGIDDLLPLHDGKPEADYDVDVELMELPHIFRTTVATIPSRVPYLHAAPLPQDAGNKRAVGLVWKAGDWDARRGVPFPVLKPLFNIPQINFYILQADAEAAGWEKGFGLYPAVHPLTHFARLVRAMSLVITVDSMPAHLAGALGVPVWNLLQAEADWRWMQDRDDSPWYPTMRLFRQEHRGDWKTVIDRVCAELKRI